VGEYAVTVQLAPIAIIVERSIARMIGRRRASRGPSATSQNLMALCGACDARHGATVAER
jgi:hypothetical protein